MTEPFQDTERRRSPRIATQLQLQGTPETGGVQARMISKDLSTGGLCCLSSMDFPEMTRLAVRLMLPSPTGGAEAIDAEAVVVRRQEVDSRSGNGARFELALFFTSMDDGSRARLARYVNA